MDEQNYFCVIYIADSEGKILALDVSTYYNYLEKESFILTNKDSIFPFEKDGVKFNDFLCWYGHVGICEITKEVYEFLLNTFKDNKYFNIIYPGY